MISIIIPVFNRESLIGATLDSIIAQNYTLWECIIVDDFSTDFTRKVIHEYASRDNRIKYMFNQRLKGAPGARNTGIEIARGEFICFFDSDDIMYSDNLQKKLNYLGKHPSVDIVTSYSDVLDINNKKIDEFKWDVSGNIFAELLNRSKYVDTNSALFRSSILQNIKWDEDCPSYQEWDFHLRVSNKAKYGFISENLCAYYKRNDGTISSDKKLDLEGRLYIYNKFKKHFVRTVGFVNFYTLINDLEKECEEFNIKINDILKFNLLENLKFKYCKYCNI